ncbi:MAG: RteC domain-containing protein [Sphingobacteriales bacterium]|nr:RteC domain-containing protein [Sphingobacteriales bacterium]OJV98444.1 MAG: hypothetical protein BGO52_11695 [Sphingobacteriales bacterium 44-61]
MQAFTRRLYEKLETQLKKIISEEYHLLKQTSQCINVCQEILKELRRYIEKNPFKDNVEEIEFFKEIKPRFYSQFIYYVKIFHIEINRPTGSDTVQRKYLKTHLHRITHFFENNLDFYQYYRSGSTHFDEVYFIRGKHDLRLFPDDLALTIDPAFCTTQSYKVSKLFANELLRIYLNAAITLLDRTDAIVPAQPAKQQRVQWTGSKVALIELIYALQSAGIFNNGSADIKQLSSYLEGVFQVELGNVYNVFQEMRIRKKNRTSFLDLLKEGLLRRMDEADESY